MSAERKHTVDHILAIEKHIYQWVQLGGLPSWAEVDLTMPQLKVLILADRRRPMPTSQVARTLGMTLSTATGVVDRLVGQGLIERLEDPSDRRMVLLRATADGKELTDRLMRGGRVRLKEILNQLGDDELRTVADALDLLSKGAVSMGADPLNTPAGAEPPNTPATEPTESEEAEEPSADSPHSSRRR